MVGTADWERGRSRCAEWQNQSPLQRERNKTATVDSVAQNSTVRTQRLLSENDGKVGVSEVQLELTIDI